MKWNTQCPFVKICKHFRNSSFTCNSGDQSYCGKFRHILELNYKLNQEKKR